LGQSGLERRERHIARGASPVPARPDKMPNLQCLTDFVRPSLKNRCPTANRFGYFSPHETESPSPEPTGAKERHPRTARPITAALWPWRQCNGWRSDARPWHDPLRRPHHRLCAVARPYRAGPDWGEGRCGVIRFGKRAACVAANENDGGWPERPFRFCVGRAA
jgi:hypothetical protein